MVENSQKILHYASQSTNLSSPARDEHQGLSPSRRCRCRVGDEVMPCALIRHVARRPAGERYREEVQFPGDLQFSNTKHKVIYSAVYVLTV